jgi:hypothetical protein
VDADAEAQHPIQVHTSVQVSKGVLNLNGALDGIDGRGETRK